MSETIKTPEPVLQVKDLNVKFSLRGRVLHAIRGVTMDIYRGESLAIVGESGSGKSVLTKTFMGLLDQNGWVDSGSIVFEGEDLTNFKTEKDWLRIRGRKIAMVLQDPMTSLNPLKTIGKQIGEALMLHQGLKGEEADKRIQEVLLDVGIDEPARRMKQYPHQFSGGMRQRVVIAIAIACQSQILICDEPTTALDVTIQAQILELMKELQNKRSSSLLMITHNLGIIAEICQRLAVMYAGAILEVGQVRDVFTNPAHPYTVGLLGAIPDLENKKETLSYIPGNVANSQMLPSGCKFHPRCQHCMDICVREAPPLKDLGNGHSVACWKCEG